MYLESSFYKEEIRSDFLVTEKVKRIWAVELQILEKFDAVCKKHNLTYYAYYGTLLGAVRHHGFIPWDTDIDLVMFRDEYERFQSIAPQEFSEPYFFQNSYTDKMIWSFCRIRDSRTTALEFSDPEINQGIFIDIFPLDDAPDGITKKLSAILEVQRVLWNIIVEPKKILSDLQQGRKIILDIDVLADLIEMDKNERYREFEKFSLAHFGESSFVNYIIDELYPTPRASVRKEWFKEIEYLPFENMRLPVPSEYDKILTHCYGDYHQLVKGASDHEDIIFDPDTPYKIFLQRT